MAAFEDSGPQTSNNWYTGTVEPILHVPTSFPGHPGQCSMVPAHQVPAFEQLTSSDVMGPPAHAHLRAVPVAPRLYYHDAVMSMRQHSSLQPHVMMQHHQAMYPPVAVCSDYANYSDRYLPTHQRAANNQVLAAASHHVVTGRQPVVLYSSNDNNRLTDYQILARKQIELFEALPEDVDTTTQGRVRRVVLGQVGIRCRHCALLPPKERKRGAFYYPSRLDVVYQASCAGRLVVFSSPSMHRLAPN
jgi:hypothetical protein